MTPLNQEPVLARTVTATPAKSSGSTATGMVATASTATRKLDAMPYYGGDNMASIQTIRGQDYLVECTAGFDYLLNSGVTMMQTAGHCGQQGQSWLQGYYDGPNNTLHYTGTMGTEASVLWGDGSTDGALLDDIDNPGGFAPYVYVSQTGAEAIGSPNNNLVVGDHICTDGAFTQENCLGSVTATNICVTEFDDYSGHDIDVCGLDSAHNSINGTPIVQAGDSGGPVYQGGTNGHVHPTGIINGILNNDPLSVLFTDTRVFDINFYGSPEQS
jgi:hypothetical protein